MQAFPSDPLADGDTETGTIPYSLSGIRFSIIFNMA
jgi:hypothetical protein